MAPRPLPDRPRSRFRPPWHLRRSQARGERPFPSCPGRRRHVVHVICARRLQLKPRTRIEFRRLLRHSRARCGRGALTSLCDRSGRPAGRRERRSRSRTSAHRPSARRSRGCRLTRRRRRRRAGHGACARRYRARRCSSRCRRPRSARVWRHGSSGGRSGDCARGGNKWRSLWLLYGTPRGRRRRPRDGDGIRRVGDRGLGGRLWWIRQGNAGTWRDGPVSASPVHADRNIVTKQWRRRNHAEQRSTNNGCRQGLSIRRLFRQPLLGSGQHGCGHLRREHLGDDNLRPLLDAGLVRPRWGRWWRRKPRSRRWRCRRCRRPHRDGRDQRTHIEEILERTRVAGHRIHLDGLESGGLFVIGVGFRNREPNVDLRSEPSGGEFRRRAW